VAARTPRYGKIRESVQRFSEKIMPRDPKRDDDSVASTGVANLHPEPAMHIAAGA
jgi:hypothetical protein